MPTPENDPQPVFPEPPTPAPAASPAGDVPASGAPTADAAPAPNGAKVEDGEGEKKKKKKKKDKANEKSKGVETMFRTSYRTNMDLSALADAKANIMISINGLIVSILIGAVAPGIETNTWLKWPTVVLLLGCLTALIFAVLAARPRVQSQAVTLEQVRQGTANLLFFGNFAHLSRDEFVTGMNDLMSDNDALYDNMVMDIYGVGRVLQKKYRLLRVSYTVFMLGLIFGVGAFIVAFFLAPDLAAASAAPSTAIPIPLGP